MPSWLSLRSRNRALIYAVVAWPLPLAAWLADDAASLSVDVWLCYCALRLVAIELCRVSSIDQRFFTLADVPRIALSVAGGSLAYGLLGWTGVRTVLVDAVLSFFFLLALCAIAAWRREQPLDKTPTLLELGDVCDGRYTVRGPADLALGFNVVGLLDSRPGSLGMTVEGIPVVGTLEELRPTLAETAARRLVLPESFPWFRRAMVIDRCRGLDVAVQSIPSAKNRLLQFDVDEWLGPHDPIESSNGWEERLRSRSVAVLGGPPRMRRAFRSRVGSAAETAADITFDLSDLGRVVVRERDSLTVVCLSEILDPQFGLLQRMIEQIEAGGPLAISHPSTYRRYTSTRHAIELILAGWIQARGRTCRAYGRQPRRELDLALGLIARTGLRPDGDIPVEYRMPDDFQIKESFPGSDGLSYPAFVVIDDEPETQSMGKLAEALKVVTPAHADLAT